MPRLMITTSIRPIAHELSDELVTLGRSPENMIQLDDPSVSGKHAQLQLVGDDVKLTDLGSTNGTTVNDAVITTALLRAGDRVRFGKVEACFECEVAGDAQPLPAMEEVEAKTAAVRMVLMTARLSKGGTLTTSTRSILAPTKTSTVASAGFR